MNETQDLGEKVTIIDWESVGGSVESYDGIEEVFRRRVEGEVRERQGIPRVGLSIRVEV